MSQARSQRMGLPDLGCGVGLRIPHYGQILDGEAQVDWFEIISENFLVEGGRPMRNLARALERYRLVQHGVSLGIGATTPLDWAYLRKLKGLVKATRTPWLTDHLCWTRHGGVDLHDLMPLPYTEEAVKHVAERARVVQDFLEVRLGLENVSSYMTYQESRMSEWAFVTAVIEEADCGLLLDVNNVFVSSYNHGFEPRDYIDGLPHERVIQYHLAGHTNHGDYIIDTHIGPIIDDVWALYRYACEKTGPVSTLVEWDEEIPDDLGVLLAEAERARAVRDDVERARAA